MNGTTEIQSLNKTEECTNQAKGTSLFESDTTTSTLATSSKNQGTKPSQKQIQAKQNNKFECTVNDLLMQIQKKDSNFTFKFDKNIQMKGEPIQRNLIRKTDKKKSNPDAEAYYKGKILCIDAKNYSKAKINEKEVNKLIGDTEARKGVPGILVIQQKSCLHEKAYKKCTQKKIAIVQLESSSTDDEHNTCDGYYNETNLERLKKALIEQFSEVSKVDIDKADKECRTLKDKESQNVLQASNYSHEKATKEFKRRKENQKKEELETQEDLKKPKRSNAKKKKEERIEKTLNDQPRKNKKGNRLLGASTAQSRTR